MSDLISRSKIRDYIKTQINPYGKPFEGTSYELGLKIMRYIDAIDSDYGLDKVVEEFEEMKTIKEMDLSIPQHFTKEQSDWIKAYCIKRNIEFYNKALDDFVNFAKTMPTVEEEDGTIRPMWLKEMAEQLKECGDNEHGYSRTDY